LSQYAKVGSAAAPAVSDQILARFSVVNTGVPEKILITETTAAALGGRAALLRPSATTGNVAMTIVMLPALPAVVYYFWYCLTFADGHPVLPSLDMVRRIPLPTWTSVAIVSGWLLFQALLQVCVAGKMVKGAPLSDGSRLTYKMNGWLAWWLTWVALAAGAVLQLYSPAKLADEFGNLLTTTNILTCALGLYLYWHGRHFGAHDENVSHNAVYDFWLGTALNPRFGNFDLKLFFEARPGLIAWVVLDFAFAAKQFQLNGFISNSMILICAFHFCYIADFFANEEAILSTWDIRHENFGWMLCWGDLVWVPFTYTIQAQYLVRHANDLPWWGIVVVLSLNVAGYTIFRGANIQKHRFRGNPEKTIWGKPPAYIRTASGSLLLISGWWGLARHMNYLGDLLMALAWCLTCGFSSPLPYFYVTYLTVLLIHRERRDNDRCARHYAEDWDAYCNKVRYRIIPGVY
jgi:protein-S-isoprenylcysteine O-methyltransferase Ste14